MLSGPSPLLHAERPLPPCSKQHKQREGQSGAVLGPLERLKDQRMRKREQRGCEPFTRAAVKPPAEKAKEVVMQGVSYVCVRMQYGVTF